MTGPIDNPDPWARLAAGWRTAIAADLFDSTPPPKVPDLAEMVEAMRDARAVISEHQAGRTGCPECGGHGHTLRLARSTVQSFAVRDVDAFVHLGGGIRFEVDDKVPPGRILRAACWTCSRPTPDRMRPTPPGG